MIHNFYIIRESGICLYHKKYGSLDEEPQSIAAFLTAVSMFSNEIVGEKVRIISTDNFKFIFKTDGKLMLTVFTDRSDQNERVLEMMDTVKIRVFQRFPGIDKVIEKGNLLISERFDSDLDEIVHPFNSQAPVLEKGG